MFSLKHGQAVTFENVPAGGCVRVIETAGHAYKVSFKDGIDPERVYSNDTDDYYLDEGDILRFDFLNAIEGIVPSGIGGSSFYIWILDMLPLIIASIALAALLVVQKKRRIR